jgi:hypothetical protein
MFVSYLLCLFIYFALGKYIHGLLVDYTLLILVGSRAATVTLYKVEQQLGYGIPTASYTVSPIETLTDGATAYLEHGVQSQVLIGPGVFTAKTTVWEGKTITAPYTYITDKPKTYDSKFLSVSNATDTADPGF